MLAYPANITTVKQSSVLDLTIAFPINYMKMHEKIKAKYIYENKFENNKVEKEIS